MPNDLTQALAKASEGSRELDARVEVAVRRFEAAASGLRKEHWAKWEPCNDGYVQDPHTRYQSRPVTTDLSAAVALCERVLPGWQWQIESNGAIPIASIGPINAVGSDGCVSESHCPTPLSPQRKGSPALALCLAVLRGRQWAFARK